MGSRHRRPRLEIGLDCPDPSALAPFWLAALRYDVVEGDGEPYLNLLPADGIGPIVFLQRVPEDKVAKNRMHLDLYSDEPAELVDRLCGLGATRVGERVGADDGWFQVLADPAGNEFCVCAEAQQPGGHPEDYR